MGSPDKYDEMTTENVHSYWNRSGIASVLLVPLAPSLFLPPDL